MNTEIQSQIDKCATRALVKDVLSGVYSGEEKEYAIKCVDIRFASIASALTKSAKLEAELEQLKANPSPAVDNSAYDEALMNNQKLSDMLQKNEETILTLKKEISEHIDNIAILTEQAKEMSQMYDEALLANEKLTDQISSHPIESKAIVAGPITNKNFFSGLFAVMNDNTGVKIIINKENDELITTALPIALVESNEFKSSIPPLTFRGTSDEHDSNFIDNIINAMNVVSIAVTDIVEFEKAISIAKAKATEAKETKAPDTKKGKAKPKEEVKSLFGESDTPTNEIPPIDEEPNGDDDENEFEPTNQEVLF